MKTEESMKSISRKAEKTVGVIIGRFQVAELHLGHKHLVKYAMGECDTVAVVLGKGGALPSERNPLPSPVRTRVIRESFPNVLVLEHRDHPSDIAWSKGLDLLLAKTFPDAKIRLYASRDGFTPHYFGELPIVVVPMIPKISGTKERSAKTNPREWNKSFRKGMIAAQHLRSDISYQAVDIAVVRYPKLDILLGQKKTDEGKWRLIGGFTDPNDKSLEEAALRELGEEAGNVMTHGLKYIGSYRVNDWRYKDERDKIMTALFLTYHLGGTPRAGDDLIKVAWHPLSIGENDIVPVHRSLIAEIVESIAKKGGVG